jgi:hypothetical protein
VRIESSLRGVGILPWSVEEEPSDRGPYSGSQWRITMTR